MLKMRDHLKNIALVLMSFILILSIIEIGMRFLNVRIVTKRTPSRALFWVPLPFEVGTNSEIRFKKNERLREIVVYHQKIEYETIYKTNNEGFEDDEDYKWITDPNNLGPRYVFVGDSFTAGSGGYSSVSSLRKKLSSQGRHIEIYNFGIPGTGIFNFDALLRTYASKGHFSHIVVVAISNDFYRRHFNPIEKNSDVYLCPHNRQSCGSEYIIGHILPRTLSDNQNYRFLDLPKTQSSKPDLEQYENAQSLDFKNSALLLWARSAVRRTPFVRGFLHRLSNKKPKKLSKVRFTPLQRIRDRFPDVKLYFIHLPEVFEVEQNNYDIDIENQVKSIGFDYFPALKRCQFSRELFYPNDSHPNMKGYQLIERCISDYLFR
jgi:lysophospholipase L1-like esterase